MGRRTTGFPPTARDGSGRRRRQLGPALTSGSGAPSYAAPARPPWSLVRLPARPGTVLAVEVSGTPRHEGMDFVVIDDTLVFQDALRREPRLRYWARLVCTFGTGAPRADERVDVWLGSARGVRVARALPVERHS